MPNALVIVDVQNDFISGTLPVPRGEEVARNIMEYVTHNHKRYKHIFTTQDWHIDPGDHWSDDPDYVDSWPVHCAAGTWGAELHPAIEALSPFITGRFFKGMYSASYSGIEALGFEYRSGILEVAGRIDVVGLAEDYCVFETAKDIAERRGYPHSMGTVNILERLTSAISDDRLAEQKKTTLTLNWT